MHNIGYFPMMDYCIRFSYKIVCDSGVKNNVNIYGKISVPSKRVIVDTQTSYQRMLINLELNCKNLLLITIQHQKSLQ